MGRSGCLYTQPMARSQGGTGKSSYNSRPSFWAVGTLGCGESGVRLPGGERESSSERVVWYSLFSYQLCLWKTLQYTEREQLAGPSIV